MNRRLILCGIALVALIGGGQSLHDGTELRIGSDTRLAWFVAMQAVAVAIYLLAVADRLGRGRSGRWEIWCVLAVAAGMRAIPLCGDIFLSSDLFRYIWDGRVQLAGFNPYTYLPIDETLAPLRDTAIFSHVHRATYAHTIYPPMAQIVFVVVAWLGQTPRLMRVAMVGFEILAMAALMLALRRRGEPLGRVLIYAWNPLAVWEFAGNGHVDAVAIGLLAVALLAHAAGRPGATGVALAGAVLVKFLPAIVAPALWRRRGVALDWRMPAAFLLTVAALYATYAGAGKMVFGFLSGYSDEEGLRDGSGLWAVAGLAKLVALPPWAGSAFLALIACGLAAASLYLLLRPPLDPVRVAVVLMVIVMIATSPHYPWYYPWLAVPAVLAPVRAAIWLGAAPLLLYLSPLHEHFIWPSLVFVPALVLLALDARRADARLPLAIATGQ